MPAPRVARRAGRPATFPLRCRHSPSVSMLRCKMCSVCGRVVEDLPLSARECTCQCDAVHDRETNGATNLRQYALDRASCARINTCGDEGSGADRKARVKTCLSEAGSQRHLYPLVELGRSDRTARCDCNLCLKSCY